MKLPRRKFLQLTAGAAALPAVSHIAAAQSYPARPITFNVPFAAGGPADAMARVMGERMRAALGQPILIENVVGAAGSIGVGRVARAAPDGYTVSLGHWSTHVVNGAIYELPYDLLKDFAPVSLLPANPQLIVSKKSVPAKNLKEFIAWLKANKSNAAAGNAGAGSASHIAEIYFQNITGTHFTLVPYRGTGPALNDLVAGQIDLILDQASNSMAQVRAGTIKAYAVTAKTRLPSLPEIPTVDEAGAPGLYISVWYGLWVPKGTPKDIIGKLNEAAMVAMADPMVRTRMADFGLEVPPPEQQTPESLGTLQKAEIEKWWPIIKAANIRGE
ncbi:MAG TPA: tripartite tricarboxylate transporter substrate-binding protein [Xanthobacteraceae bacterium]|nr:tripartite tricarboxylate transporter substrate-binding protein [Xanthobacteraceae bacterium]